MLRSDAVISRKAHAGSRNGSALMQRCIRLKTVGTEAASQPALTQQWRSSHPIGITPASTRQRRSSQGSSSQSRSSGVATDDHDAFEARGRGRGAGTAQARGSRSDGRVPAGVRASSDREEGHQPGVCQVPQASWTRRADKHDSVCRLVGFELQHPADDLNPLLESIESPVRVATGRPSVRITFESPNGIVPIDGTGFSGSSLELAAHVAGGLLRR